MERKGSCSFHAVECDAITRRLKYGFMKKWGRRIKKYLNIRNMDRITDKTMYLSVQPENFYELSREYLNAIVNLKRKEIGKTLVLDQPFSGDNPYKSFPFFEDPYAIIVDKDPRDMYLLAKMSLGAKGSFIPSGNVDDFIVYYRAIMSYRDRCRKDLPNVLYLHFEDLIYDSENTRNRIEDFLGIHASERICSCFDKTKSINNTQLFLKYTQHEEDIRKIEMEALAMKGTITAMEAHSGLTGLIVENTVVEEDGGARQFDAMWVFSLCDSTAKGKPDIELVDMTSRFRTIDDICEVTTKPIIFDADTGGLTEHFVYTVRSLERMGVSMAIIEDKTGLKKNSLFGNEVAQTQDSIENFSEKIRAGKKAQRTKDFMICARIESLILERGMEDALERAFAFTEAGADAIMIHSRKKDPSEIFEFVEKYRAKNQTTPIVVVPTSFNTVTEEEFKARGVNIVIYANQLTRTGFPAMQNAAKLILKNHRAKECDDICMPFKDIIRLIPEE